ncbi:hypothetical protein DRH14_00955, partial [Candidatus Shapirobacteria bacterium]
GTTSPGRTLQIGGSSTGDWLRIASDSRNWDLGVSYSGGDDKFVIYDATAAQPRLIIDTTGNVGIGDASPDAKLDVAGTGRFDSNVYVSMDNTTNHGLILSDDGGIYDRNDGYASLAFSNGIDIEDAQDTGDHLTITLNNSYPEIWSYVNGSTTLTEFRTGIYNNGGTFYSENLIEARSNINLRDSPTDYIYSSGGTRVRIADDLGVDGQAYFGGNADPGGWEVYANGQIYVSDYLRADGGIHVGGSSDPGTDNLIVDGNVGIGDASPDAKLDVEGTIYATGYGRDAHNEGHLIGSYNSVGGNSAKSNPIYTIGSNYNPNDASLGNMYGIGYSHTNASFITDPGPDSWGMYIAGDGDARNFIAATSGGSSYFNAGNVGIGTANPTKKLHVYNTIGSHTPVVKIQNYKDVSSDSVRGMTITLGTNSNNPGNDDDFIVFSKYSATPLGSIDGSGTGTLRYNSSGADFAEYIKTSEIVKKGEILFIKNNSTINKHHGKLIGIVSTTGAFVGNNKHTNEEDDSYALMSMMGQVPTITTNLNGISQAGDPITSSSLPGIGMKATKAGPTVGQALESTEHWNKQSCPAVSSLAAINWPEDDGTNPTKPCFKVPISSLDAETKANIISQYNLTENDYFYVGKIMVFVNVSWYDPDVYLTNTGQLQIDYNIDPNTLASLGYTATKNEIESATYSLTDQLGQQVTRISQFAQLASAKIKTSFLSATNIITKNLVAENTKTKNIKTTTISPLSDITDTIVVNGNLDIANTLTTTDLQAQTATISTLYADNIVGQHGSFSDLLSNKISSLRAELTQIVSNIGNTLPGESDTLAQSDNWYTEIASDSATIHGNLSLSNDMIIHGQLQIQGQTQLASAFVTGTFSAGQIALHDNLIETTNSDLYIQPSAIGTIHLLGDTMLIADSGNITINANLDIQGQLSSQQIYTEDIQATTASFSSSLMANLIETVNASISGQLTANKINIATASSTIIADSAMSTLATTSAKLETNATAGTATLPTNKTELVIFNHNLTDNSMVYLTPQGSTNNQVIYIKEKADDHFTIAIDTPLNNPLDINWWIIN